MTSDFMTRQAASDFTWVFQGGAPPGSFSLSTYYRDSTHQTPREASCKLVPVVETENLGRRYSGKKNPTTVEKSVLRLDAQAWISPYQTARQTCVVFYSRRGPPPPGVARAALVGQSQGHHIVTVADAHDTLLCSSSALEYCDEKEAICGHDAWKRWRG